MFHLIVFKLQHTFPEHILQSVNGPFRLIINLRVESSAEVQGSTPRIEDLDLTQLTQEFREA